ncbi:acyltransferase family protein [Methylobrevis pamukkalensis]|uniref:Acyltransferase family protein n=1 Tax=Methylobrevis pamukkalensis TaxID=1439726 RepID=A0A1E3H0I1_9HYPH|nr:acyltransferase [Methylobrevis pamukkalensis]ODN69655.1 Acyltransferase family protein [Methylobrevis pamukkalensis]
MTERGTFQHYHVFDAWRFGAAMTVMLYHFLHYDPTAATWMPQAAEKLQQVIDLFFILSGFVIMSSYGTSVRSLATFRSFIVRRLSRIYPLHLLTLGFFVAIGVAGALGIVHLENPARFDLATVPLHLLMIHAWGLMPDLTFNYVSWSLSAEWMAYLAFPAIALAYRRGGLPALFATCVAPACWSRGWCWPASSRRSGGSTRPPSAPSGHCPPSSSAAARR